MMLPDFENITNKEAKAYFEKFVADIPERIAILEEYANKQCGANIPFDYTVESLKPLWAWFETVMAVEEMTEEDIKRELSEHADWMKEIILQDTTQETLETIAISLDIAVYFAEVFRRHNAEKIYWTYIARSKRHASYNRPVLKGFINNVDMDAVILMSVATKRSLREKKSDRLIEIYSKWLEYIPKD